MLFDKEAIKRKCLVFPMSAPHGLEKAPGVTDCSLATGGFWGSSPLARTTSNHVQHLSQYLTHPGEIILSLVLSRSQMDFTTMWSHWLEIIVPGKILLTTAICAIWRSLRCCRIWCAVEVQFSNWFYSVKKLLEPYSYVYLWHTMWFHA